MGKSYTRQNLQGRSFANQNLQEVDFSDSDLRSCNFSGSDLTRAKFCRVKVGKTWLRQLFVIALAALLGVLAVGISGLGNALMTLFIDVELKTVNSGKWFKLLVYACYSLGQGLAVWVALKYQRWQSFVWYNILVAILVAVFVAVLMSGAGVEAIAEGMAVVVAGALLLGLALIVAIIAAATVVGAGSGAVALVGAMAGGGVIVGPGAVIMLFQLTLGMYLSHRALNFEEPMLLFLRRAVLAWRCWGSTNFRGATLKDVDFSGTDLSYCRFSKNRININPQLSFPGSNLNSLGEQLTTGSPHGEPHANALNQFDQEITHTTHFIAASIAELEAQRIAQITAEQRHIISEVLQGILQYEVNLSEELLEAVYDVRKVVKADAEQATVKTQLLLSKLWQKLMAIGDFAVSIEDIHEFVRVHQVAIGIAVIGVADLLR